MLSDGAKTYFLFFGAVLWPQSGTLSHYVQFKKGPTLWTNILPLNYRVSEPSQTLQ